MSDKKTPLDTIREAIEYGKGCAAIVETIMNVQGVPMENMQHCVEGFWRREKEALAALRSMEGSEPAPAVVESKRPTVEQVMEVVVNWLERSGDEIGFSHTMKDLRSRLTKLLGDGE